MEKLIEIHDKLKNHPFRESFISKGEFLKGTYLSQMSEYLKLIYESTEIFCDMIYCKEPILSKDDGFWIHDFRSLLYNIRTVHGLNYFEGDDLEKYLDRPRDSLGMTLRDFYSFQGILDISNVMIFLDNYIGTIHQYIETGIFNKIFAVKYETAIPGWYLKHRVLYEKVNGVWEISEASKLKIKETREKYNNIKNR